MKRQRRPDPMSLLPWHTDVGTRHRRRAEACNKPVGRARMSRPAIISRSADPSASFRLEALQRDMNSISLAVRRIGQAVAGEHERHAAHRETLDQIQRRLADIARATGALEVPTAPRFNGRNKPWEEA
jgi:hypothetical protein